MPMCRIPVAILLAAAVAGGVAESSKHPATAARLRRPRECREETWRYILRKLPKYPAEYPPPGEDVLLVRAASQPAKLAAGGDWLLSKEPIPTIVTAKPPPAGAARSVFLVRHKPTGARAYMVLLRHPNAIRALAHVLYRSASRFGGSARISTWTGSVAPVAVRRASFVANYNEAPRNSLMWSAENVEVWLYVVGDPKDNYVRPKALGALASRLSVLLEPPDEKKVAEASSEQLVLRVASHEKGSAVLKWATPKKGGLDGHWIRVDTSAGKLSLDKDARVRLADIPAAGAKVTCWAVSADGRQWLRVALDVPGRAPP